MPEDSGPAGTAARRASRPPRRKATQKNSSRCWTALGRPPRPAANLFLTLARHPVLLRDWLPLGSRLLLGGTLPPRDRELVILRTAWLCGCEYEWGHHVRIGGRAGLSVDEIADVRDPAAARWSGHDAAVLRATGELVRDHTVSQATWDALAETYDDAALIEFTMLAGHYVMLAGLLNAARVAGDAGTEGFPQVPARPERHLPAVVIARVTPMFDCPAVSPTAVQEPGTGQDTPNNSVSTAPAGAGTACSRHRVPSQVSAKAPRGGEVAGRVDADRGAGRRCAAGHRVELVAAIGDRVGAGLDPPGGAVPRLGQRQRAAGRTEVRADRDARAGRGARQPDQAAADRGTDRGARGRRGTGHREELAGQRSGAHEAVLGEEFLHAIDRHRAGQGQRVG